MKFVLLAYLVLCICYVSADSSEHDKPEHEKDSHKPYDRDLSDHEHHDGDEEKHDARYDHDAFLGKEEAAEFDKLSPEESLERLGHIVDKIDVNGDKKITQEELRQWIRNIGQKSITTDTKKQFEALKPKDDKVYWETYALQNYGKPEERPTDEKDMMKQHLLRDERKWKKADQDGDGALSLKEFTAFVHPEEAPHMREIVVEEAMADMDKNKDGYISADEYLQDQWEPTEKEPTEPEWLKDERAEFSKSRDKNGDGRMDTEELGEWLLPKDYDQSESEAQHLVQKSDADNDGVLTKEEIMKNHDLFVGSQATDYGNALNRHEEL